MKATITTGMAALLLLASIGFGLGSTPASSPAHEVAAYDQPPAAVHAHDHMAFDAPLATRAESSEDCAVDPSVFSDGNNVGITAGGVPDPDWPETVGITWVSIEDYLCLYPDDVSQGDDVEAAELQDWLLNGDPQQGASLISQRAPLIPVPPPAAPTGPVEAARETIDEQTLGRAISGKMVLRVFLPGYGDHISTNGYCRWSYTDAATAALKSELQKGRTTTLTWEKTCYYLNSAGQKWTTCGCTHDVHSVLSSLKSFIGSTFPSFVDATNELVTTYISHGSNNGVGEQPGKYSLVSETTDWKPDSPETSIMVHEIGHNLGASHYPDNSGSKNLCSNGSGTYYESVMNYCHMYWGWTTFDTGNRNTIQTAVW